MHLQASGSKLTHQCARLSSLLSKVLAEAMTATPLVAHMSRTLMQMRCECGRCLFGDVEDAVNMLSVIAASPEVWGDTLQCQRCSTSRTLHHAGSVLDVIHGVLMEGSVHTLHCATRHCDT